MSKRTQNRMNGTSAPITFAPSGLLQRKCDCGNHTIASSECGACSKKGKAQLQPAAANFAPVNEAPPIVHEVLRSTGQPLDLATPALMGPRFGHDLSAVRAHTDARAAKLAQRDTLVDQMGVLKPSLFGVRPSDSKLFESKTGPRPAEDRQWTADIEVVRNSSTQKNAILSDSDEANIADTEDDSVVKMAQADPGVPAPAPGVFPPSPPVPATPTCKYSITYANLKNHGCGGGHCGAKIVYDITKVTATGSGCPAKLEGLKLTETVTTDAGCIPGDVTTGPGCTIGAGGAITGCTDTYALCSPADTFPAAGCTEKYTQKLFVGGVHAETRTITFRITKSGGKCSGTVTRT